MSSIEFSVMIPVFHGGSFLNAALRSVMALDYPPGRFELLVAAAAGDDPSRIAVEKAASEAAFPVRHVPCRSSNRARWLNRTCALAAGRILAFTDDDCVIPPGWLREIAAVLDGKDDIGAVGGGDDLLGVGAFDQALDWVLNSFVGSGRCRFGDGLRAGRFYPKLWNMAVPRAVAMAVALPGGEGGEVVFDESLPVHEDVELMGRIEGLGKEILYAPTIRVSHYRDTNFRSLLRRNFDMARACRREGMHRFAHCLLAGALLTAAFLAATAIWWPLPRRLFFSGSGFYAALLVLSTATAAAAGRSLKAVSYIPAMLAGVHMARGLGYLFPAGRRARGDRGR